LVSLDLSSITLSMATASAATRGTAIVDRWGLTARIQSGGSTEEGLLGCEPDLISHRENTQNRK
jgi:hypothetical protein